ncbi:hypothetical protein ABNF97_27600 [Plantactinospora sp. B6F1]|uniref:hypothetical protein n=1 Tax=Plantactinospora sp. B6F1 TaxID=3158971 RepID=UPI00102CFE7D
MTSYDAYWMATSATVATWVYALHVQPFHVDVEAALAATEWPTATEAAGLMLKEIGVCTLALHGYRDTPFEAEVHASLLTLEPELVETMSRVPVPIGAGEAEARSAARLAFEAEERLVERLPIYVPMLRSPEGFFPALRLGADLDKLRDTLQMPKTFWRNWIP